MQTVSTHVIGVADGKMGQLTAILGTTVGAVIDAVAELYDKAVSSGSVDGSGNLNEDGVEALKEDVCS